mmetsp:Transcript_19664/g.34859  ORF Transcript_19664/g.34859 Transcript_19664/m.34859 type:complete len:642 (-) Transcript_19664:71-1996(-)
MVASMALDAGRALNKLKAEELKSLCKEQGLPASGKKADLIARLVELRKASEADSSELERSPGKAVEKAKSPRRSPAASSLPVSGGGAAGGRKRGRPPSAVKSSPSGGSAGGSSASNGRMRTLNVLGKQASGIDLSVGPGGTAWAASRQQQLRCCICEAHCDLGHARYTGDHTSFRCPICRFKEMDPFNAVVEGGGVLKYMLVTQPRFDFTLDCPDLRQWRRDGKGIEVRMMRVDASKACQVWPTQIHFFVNRCEAFAVHPPEEGHKRRDVPHSIAATLKAGRNDIEVQMVDDDCAGLALAVLLTAPQSPDTLAAQVQRCAVPVAKQRICELLASQAARSAPASGDAAEDIVCLTSDTLKLTCPITMERVEEPVRGLKCQHLQCFSLSAYVTSNRQMGAFNKRWVCPLCTLVLRPPDLCVDGYVKKVLASAPKDIDEVVVSADGSWRAGDMEMTKLSDDEGHPGPTGDGGAPVQQAAASQQEPFDLDSPSPPPRRLPNDVAATEAKTSDEAAAASVASSPSRGLPGFALAVAMSVVGGAFRSPQKGSPASSAAASTAAARQRRSLQMQLEDDDISPSVKAAPAKRRFAAAVDAAGASKRARASPSASAQQAATPARSPSASIQRVVEPPARAIGEAATIDLD